MAKGASPNRDFAMSVDGLAPFQRALRRAEGDLDKFTRDALRAVAEPIIPLARRNISHRTGRHSAPPGQRLEDSLKIGVTQRAVSVYTMRPWAGIRERGGHIGHGAIIPPARADHFLSRAVQEDQANTESRLVELGDKIIGEVER